MHRLFLDANIFFTATYSSQGASRALFDLAQQKKILLTTNTYALAEAKKNIEYKIGNQSLPLFFHLISLLIRVSTTEIKINDRKKYKTFIEEKDIPILLGALQTKTDYLITLDRGFKNTALMKKIFPLRILLPGEYLQSL